VKKTLALLPLLVPITGQAQEAFAPKFDVTLQYILKADLGINYYVQPNFRLGANIEMMMSGIFYQVQAIYKLPSNYYFRTTMQYHTCKGCYYVTGVDNGPFDIKGGGGGIVLGHEEQFAEHWAWGGDIVGLYLEKTNSVREPRATTVFVFPSFLISYQF
jgi:hypothetical protein